jgi:hypothetical protein
LIVARKSKSDAASSDKIRKNKPVGTSTSPKTKKTALPKKRVVAKVKEGAVPVPAKAFGATDEQIQMRAYFISERRRRFALPGDANSDWLEAKRQLLAEVRH